MIRLGVHYFLEHDRYGRVDVDVLVIDRDLDGAYNCEVRWDLPGTVLDSGAEPFVIPIPGDLLFGGIEKLLPFLAGQSKAGQFVVALAGDLRRVLDSFAQ